jgi:hypothetical protein
LLNFNDVAILINGPTIVVFKPSRGLRQGCRLSPLLFLLVVEGLSQKIKEEKKSGALKGVKTSGYLSLSHLLFMDDVLIFLEGSIKEARKMHDILETYCMASGMDLNLQKSSMVLYGVDEVLGQFLQNVFPFKLLNINDGCYTYKWVGFRFFQAFKRIKTRWSSVPPIVFVSAKRIESINQGGKKIMDFERC